MELQRRKELTEQMFHGMARIVDRFVVCDLENDHYEPCLAGSWIIWVKNKVLSAQTAPYFYGLHVQQAALLLILAGGIGNLIDRVLNGEVVDYINLLFMQFAVFNFADICVCVGVGLWVLVIFLEELHAENGQSPKEQ